MVHDAVLPLPGLSGLGQLVDQVHVPGEAPGAPDAAHRGQAAEIDPDPDGYVPLLGNLHHFFHLVFVAQVAGIQAQAVHPAHSALDGQLVVEVDVGDERDVDLLLDFRHGLGRFHVGHRRPDDVAARLFQFVNLAHGGLHVPRIGLGHGLDGDVGVPAYFHAADVHWLGSASLLHGSNSRWWPGKWWPGKWWL